MFTRGGGKNAAPAGPSSTDNVKERSSFLPRLNIFGRRGADSGGESPTTLEKGSGVGSSIGSGGGTAVPPPPPRKSRLAWMIGGGGSANDNDKPAKDDFDVGLDGALGRLRMKQVKQDAAAMLGLGGGGARDEDEEHFRAQAGGPPSQQYSPSTTLVPSCSTQLNLSALECMLECITRGDNLSGYPAQRLQRRP